MRGHDAGSSGRKSSGGSSSTGKRTVAGTWIVSESGSEGMGGMVARRVRGGNGRTRKRVACHRKCVAGPHGVESHCISVFQVT